MAATTPNTRAEAVYEPLMEEAAPGERDGVAEAPTAEPEPLPPVVEPEAELELEPPVVDPEPVDEPEPVPVGVEVGVVVVARVEVDDLVVLEVELAVLVVEDFEGLGTATDPSNLMLCQEPLLSE
jgi:hypothetical protein